MNEGQIEEFEKVEAQLEGQMKFSIFYLLLGLKWWKYD